jgi:putative ABC transport system ATP-binding protein
VSGLFSFQDVNVAYDGVRVLRDFNLEVNRGEKVLIYGKSGIGKSTVLRLLLGFAVPDSGSVFFEDRSLDPPAAWEVRRRAAYVSQDLDIAAGRVEGLVERTMRHKANQPLQPSRQDLDAALALFDLEPEILRKEITDLSGGERQRVALALALLLRRDIFLLDEATSALDAPMKSRVVEYFTGQDEWTVLCVSHDRTWLEGGRMRVIEMGVG